MGKILLEEMDFFAYHGHFEEEQIVGNKFKINLILESDTEAAAISDNLKDALDYQSAYKIVRNEMLKKSHLLENISGRILDALFDAFPQLESATLKVSKMNPPMGGRMKCVSVEVTRRR